MSQKKTTVRPRRTKEPRNSIEKLLTEIKTAIEQRTEPSVDTASLKRIEEGFFGNGHEGVLTRTARIEENLVQVSENSKANAKCNQENAKNIGDLAESIRVLKDAVETHTKTTHLIVLAKKKSFWVGILFSFLALSMITRYLPNLWNLLVVFLGAPYLVLPLE